MRRSDSEISAIMRKVHSGDTTPELLFRKALWAAGLRYKISPSNLPGKPDVVLPSRKLAIFIDGDYWHGNQWKLRGHTCLEEQFESTKSGNKEYWLKKIRRNMERDSRRTADLVAEGWTVLRFWESDIKKRLEECIEMAVAVAKEEAVDYARPKIQEKTFAEFFAGIGLMRMGLELEGWSIALANDIDKQKYEMYKTHFDDAENHYLVGDVHKLNGENIPSFTLATASFPCNDLSLAGAREGLNGK